MTTETTAATPAKSAVETIKLSDGREVDFVGKRKLLKETLIDEHGKVAVRLDFRNGETRTFHLPHDLMAQFAGHGAEQKLGDETAGVDDVDDMVIAVDELIDRLHRGEWSTRREGSGFAGTSVLLRALVEYSNGKRSIEQVKEFLKGKSQAEKMALRNSPKVKPIVERLEAEKLSKGSKVDTDALLSDLG
jgi:hypothetical protein